MPSTPCRSCNNILFDAPQSPDGLCPSCRAQSPGHNASLNAAYQVWNPPGAQPTATQRDGWRCPSCGRCYAPWKPSCDFCGTGVVAVAKQTVPAQVGPYTYTRQPGDPEPKFTEPRTASAVELRQRLQVLRGLQMELAAAEKKETP